MINKKQDVIVGKYQPKKKQNLTIYEFINNKLSEGGRELFKDCSTFNQFISTSDKEKSKLIASNSCKNRFCPICAWRKACKDALKIAMMMEVIKLEEKKEFLFLTLTTPNIKGDAIRSEIDRFNKAFNKLFKRRNVARSIKGYIRKLEMTYNKERDDYNPHFHVLLCVDKSYFKKKELYIKQNEWLLMWREVTGLSEITQVHIQKVDLIREGNAVAEVAKYSAKDYEMATSQDVFDVFYSGLKGRQLIVYSGMFKEYALKYENGELDKYKSKDKNEYFYKIIAKWNSDLFKFHQVYVELTEEEKMEYNGGLQKEIEVEN
ncbi:replication protein (plasmid) [Bacillus thuringiensis LM1212]|uniref:protein rep n=1 Tax=Bacillus thuringiensis TaxID=1428 RepID=UPI00041E2707|nr:protein rep [Bacillus thuringiensis]AXY11599.1 replication protein [Bacillus thuringiensis LM1212]OTZ11136.1 replication protein [Bacillus thuringiensis serovar aizawai]QDF27071.1 replication protein [Bacillus tropicus]